MVEWLGQSIPQIAASVDRAPSVSTAVTKKKLKKKAGQL